MSTPERRFRRYVSIVLMAGFLGSLFGAVAGTSGLLRAAAASDPVIAAAGDIACDPTNAKFNGGLGASANCRQKYTSDLLVNAGLAAVLDLGDNQYYCGGYQAFLQSYDLSWGRVKSITHPSVGNHEYLTAGGTDCNINNEAAAGYFNYFGSAAGASGQGWYSFDVGSWHIIALNSNCSDAGGCASGTAQYNWLQADLAAHTNTCTLAYWHIPLYSSGGRAAQNSKTFWQLLYQYNADVVLNGHDHIYERFAPQDANGVVDTARELREFIVGTGGSDHTTIPLLAANSEVRNADTFGVLKLALHATSYDWQFVPESGGAFRDSGSGTCHNGAPTPTPTAPVATPTSGGGSVLFGDGFESGDLSQWTTVQGLTVRNQEVADGSFAARGTTAAGGATYARKQLPAPQSDLYYRIKFKIISQGQNTVNLMKLRTSTDGPILGVSVSNAGKLGYRNDVAGASVNSTVAVGAGAWQTLQVHLHVADTASQIEVWYNGALVSALTRTDSFGINQIGRIQLGENTPGLTYDVAFDDVAAGTGYLSGSSGTATPTSTLPVPTVMPSTTSAAPTNTLAPTVTGTALPSPSFTPTPASDPALFSDGFESGDLSQWTTVQGLTVQSQEVAGGNFAARGTKRGRKRHLCAQAAGERTAGLVLSHPVQDNKPGSEHSEPAEVADRRRRPDPERKCQQRGQTGLPQRRGGREREQLRDRRAGRMANAAGPLAHCRHRKPDRSLVQRCARE